MQRRSFIRHALVGTTSLTTSGMIAQNLFTISNRQQEANRKYRLSLKADAIGVTSPVPNLLIMAANLGFEAIAMPSDQVVGFGVNELKTLQQKANDLGLDWGSAGLPLEFRNSKEEYDRDMGQLPQHARAMAALGITRVGTWIMPCNDTRSYTENMAFHAERLRPAAQIMADHGVRLGLEYVGPRTLRDARKYAFVVNGLQLSELIAAIDV
ncbi:MAG: TIM barrel protein, partial [Bacteroidota bacterium]